MITKEKFDIYIHRLYGKEYSPQLIKQIIDETKLTKEEIVDIMTNYYEYLKRFYPSQFPFMKEGKKQFIFNDEKIWGIKVDKKEIYPLPKEVKDEDDIYLLVHEDGRPKQSYGQSVLFLIPHFCRNYIFNARLSLLNHPDIPVEAKLPYANDIPTEKLLSAITLLDCKSKNIYELQFVQTKKEFKKVINNEISFLKLMIHQLEDLIK